MKLYTEEQVRKAHQNGRNGGHNETWYDTDDYIKLLTPIELPSDEEINEKADEYVENKWEYAQDECKETFKDGAKWLKEQILNQNK